MIFARIESWESQLSIHAKNVKIHGVQVPMGPKSSRFVLRKFVWIYIQAILEHRQNISNGSKKKKSCLSCEIRVCADFEQGFAAFDSRNCEIPAISIAKLDQVDKLWGLSPVLVDSAQHPQCAEKNNKNM